MSDINDSTAAANAATPAEDKPTTPVRRNAATQGAPRGAGSRTAKQGRTMLGAEAVVASLEAEGVTTVFGYPGGQAIKLYDALYDSDQITHVLARHEQGAVHMADGYARSTGRAGVAIVTSGPGATNTVTGIATAYMDSVPLVIITGQVGRGVIGTDSFQESDIVGITMPVVKHSYLLQSTDELTRTIREAFHIAVTGRPGPVLIDIPSDVAGETMVFEYPDAVNLPSYKPTYRGNAKQIRAACRLLEEAEQPLLYVGGGVISSEATDEIVALMDKMRIPAVVTLMGKGGVPASHPLNLGPVGMHGAKYSNMAMTEADLIIAAGARFSDRVTGRVTEFAPNAKIVHIDIDPAEIGKIRDADVPIVGDLKGIIAGMLEVLEKDGAAPRVDIGDPLVVARGVPATRSTTRTWPRTRRATRSFPSSSLLSWDASWIRRPPLSPPRWASTRCGRTSFCPASSRAPSFLLGGSAPWASASRPPSGRRWRTPMPRWSASPATGRSR